MLHSNLPQQYKKYNDDVLVSILSNYYESNYYGLTFEQDARFVGSKMVVFLLKKYFPFIVGTN